MKFEIDHYQPQAAGGTSEYDNLLYSCDECNGAKDAYWPPPERQNEGHRYFRPDRERASETFRLEGIEIKPRSTVGLFTIEMLYLNQQSHKRLRAARQRLHDSQAIMLQGLRSQRDLPWDRLPPRVRGMVRERSRQVREDAELTLALLEQELRELQRCPMLDKDPEAETRARDRRKWLSQVKSPLDSTPWYHRRSTTE